MAPAPHHLLAAPHRLARLRALAEIKLNNGLYPGKAAGADVLSFDAFRQGAADFVPPAVAEALAPGGEAEAALAEVLAGFEARAAGQPLGMPRTYNADPSLALLLYALTRSLQPEAAIETGVAYGVSSALMLTALARNGRGHLHSIDLPPLSDAHGATTGLAVPEALRPRWTLYTGDSRHWLRRLLRTAGPVSLFVSDSANVFTLQRYELRTVWPHLAPGGAAVFNNVSRRFWEFAGLFPGSRSVAIRQQQKTDCVTGLVWKDPAPA